MKVMFLFQGLAHYYNYVLSRLSEEACIQVINVVPRRVSAGLGAGVYQSSEGIRFELRELDEYPIKPTAGRFVDCRTFSCLTGLTSSSPRRHTFGRSLPAVDPAGHEAMRRSPDSQSIPFRLSGREASLSQIGETFRRRVKDSPLAFPWHASQWLARRAVLAVRAYSYRFPQAHVNYVEDAYAIYGASGCRVSGSSLPTIPGYRPPPGRSRSAPG